MSSDTPGEAILRQEPTTIWNRAFISIFFTNMAFNMGQLMSNSLLSIYANSLGAPASAIGLLMGTFAFASIAFRFISAPIMDTYNRKYIVVVATLTLATAFFGFSMSKTIPSLMCFRLLQGCGMAFGNACCMAMVSELIPKDKYSTGIGYYSMAQVVCQMLGPSIGLWLVGLVGYSATFIINACVMLVAAFLAFQIKTQFVRTRTLKFSFHNTIAREALLPSTMLFLLNTGSTTVGSFLIVFARNQGVAGNIGLYFLVSASTMLVTRPIIGRLTDKFGLVKVVIPALFCNVLSFFVISYSNTLWSFLFAAFISAFGYGACQPAMQALSMKTVPNERRGAASSTNFIGMDLGNLLGPTVGGVVAQSMGYEIMWRAMAAPFLIGVALLFTFRKLFTRIEQDFSTKQP